jgi:hypothetical protein
VNNEEETTGLDETQVEASYKESPRRDDTDTVSYREYRVRVEDERCPCRSAEGSLEKS